MRITGYRMLTTIHDWLRPVGDANGVFDSGVTDVRIVLVDTDEGITGVGLGSHVELDSIFAAVEGEDPRSTTALYDRMLRQTFKAGHAAPSSAPSAPFDTALWDIKAQAGGRTAMAVARRPRPVVPAYASGLDFGLSDDELVALYRPMPSADCGRPSSRAASTSITTGAGSRWCATCSRRQREPPGLMLDANESWTRKQAVRHVAEIERTLDLVWVEEPVRRWDAEGLAAVGRGIRAPWPPARISPAWSSTARCWRPGRSTSSRRAWAGASPTSCAWRRWRTRTIFR
jgi:L-alanine-DL-glutamate epimerase-like enolase superfamily enzyme